MSAHVSPTNSKFRLETEDLRPETGSLCLGVEDMKSWNEERSRMISKSFLHFLLSMFQLTQRIQL